MTYRLFWMVGGLMFIVIGLVAYGVVAHTFKDPDPRMLALTKDLRVIAVQSYDKPVSSTQSVAAWASRALMDTLDIDAAHWRSDLERSRQYYTPEAFVKVVPALNDSGILPFVRKNRLILRATPLEPMTVTREQLFKGAHTYWVEMPVRLSYESQTGLLPHQDVLIKSVIKREDIREYPTGVAITQLLVKNR